MVVKYIPNDPTNQQGEANGTKHDRKPSLLPVLQTPFRATEKYDFTTLSRFCTHEFHRTKSTPFPQFVILMRYTDIEGLPTHYSAHLNFKDPDLSRIHLRNPDDSCRRRRDQTNN